MRIISVCSEDRSERGSESDPCSTSEQERLMSRGTSQNLNLFDNLTDKIYEKHLTVVVNPNRFHRNMPCKAVRNIDRNDRSLSGSTPGNTVRSTTGHTIRSWQSCEDNKSVSSETLSTGSSRPGVKNSKIQKRLVKGLCLVGWIVCCPCWAVGFVLREPPETDADLEADPCWPCSS